LLANKGAALGISPERSEASPRWGQIITGNRMNSVLWTAKIRAILQAFR
jgi:hypothetical protein